MTLAIMIAVVAAWGAMTVRLALRSWISTIYLSSAFTVSGGVLFYLWLTGTMLPIVGTLYHQAPAVAAGRAAVHLTLAAVCGFFGVRRARRALDGTATARVP